MPSNTRQAGGRMEFMSALAAGLVFVVGRANVNYTRAKSMSGGSAVG